MTYWLIFYAGLVLGTVLGLIIFSLLNMAADPGEAPRRNSHDG